MRAVVVTRAEGPEALEVGEVEDPAVGDCEVLIRVAAATINRADTFQRRGSYPLPPGASPILGVECSSTVLAVGHAVTRWRPGDQVCALLARGGYAEKVTVPEGQVLPIPAGISLRDAARFPEVACTIWSTVFMMSRLSSGESFLRGVLDPEKRKVYISSELGFSGVTLLSDTTVGLLTKTYPKLQGHVSGIGTFAIQIAKHIGAKVFVTAGSEEKLAACKHLGADVCINYKTEEFVARVKEETGGKGVDVILDNIGAAYFQRNLDSLNFNGRLFIIGFQGGTVAETNLWTLFVRRLTVQAAGLRSRSLENKAEIVREVEKHVWPAIEAGKVKPVVYKSFPLPEAAEAHRLMESSAHIGKILLIP